MKYLVFILLISVTLISCSHKVKHKAIYESIVDVQEDSLDLVSPAYSMDYTGNVEIPFRGEDGVKYVSVKVNGVSFDMIFDTGCSTALISIAEAQYLYNKGKIRKSDFCGTQLSQIANGEIVEDMIINLENVILADKLVFHNIKASVSKNAKAPLLLGNAVMDRVSSVTIDNKNKTLNFKLGE